MKTSRLFYALIAAIVLLHAAAATADSIDMNDPRRTVGREGDVRIDAQLVQDTVSPGSPIAVTWQIENLSATPVAVADKVADATYDADSRTITLSIGSEVPQDGKMPHVVTIAPGEKRLFRTGATPALAGAAARTSLAAPRFVQVKVSILRDLAPFAQLIAAQSESRQPRAAQPLSDELFDQWFESNDTIFLNTVPVRFSARRGMAGFASADQRASGGGM
ncbi:MAG TPA: hypothetical protein VFV49_08900 [Thermoanaerobaculia bacterium]|nr:hypothetical protein [Thermoanaerobaculia bacterium]